ncbi:MAG TPA: hypothetical protein VKP65_18655 [Rhodothermales bacterium]|nr:hypothetical protein [Rhodothermales bacterium]
MTKEGDTGNDGKPLWKERIKVLLGIELVALVISFVVVLMPRRGTTDLINLPPDLASYVRRVLTSFGAFNAVLLVLVLTFWIFTRFMGQDSDVEDAVANADND